MELILERSTIRSWKFDDADSLARHANNRQVWLRVRDLFPHPYTIADARTFLEKAIVESPRTRFCIDVGGQAVGGIGIRLGEDVHRLAAEVGYWLSEEFWGRGIMSEAVIAFADYCFSSFHLVRICAQTHANNSGSARVLEKAGFVLEGRIRKNVIKDGEILDSLLYAKIIESEPNQ